MEHGDPNEHVGTPRTYWKIGIAGVALAVSILSVLFTGLDYFQTQRPRLGFDSDSRRLNTSVIDGTREHYKVGFVFQNGGNMPCKGVKLNVSIMTSQRKIGEYEKQSANDILSGSLFHQIVDFDIDWKTRPEDLLFFVELEYPAFPLGKHRQDVYLTFRQASQGLYHSDTPEVELMKQVLRKK